MEIISTLQAPAAIGPYSQAVKSGNTLYCSGQIGLDPQTGEFVSDEVGPQMQQVMKNLGSVLKAAGYTWKQVVKCSIFLKDLGDFVTINEIYANYFPENPPARETVEVSRLPKDAKVEISLIAQF